MKSHKPRLSVGQQPGVLAELPRRRHIEVNNGDSALTKMRFVSFEVRQGYALRRLFTWLRLVFYFFANTLFDRLLGRDSVERQAVRLRQAFERTGGSFIKLGIHLSMRADILPWTYCNELSRLPDRMKPFPLAQAIATLERVTQKPLTATFAQFDPEPILSTSVANIYQAVLHDGVKVAVKVRRPGIGQEFMADVKAFDWLLSIAEFLTIFRPGFTKGMRTEFRDLLLEELDFVQEARRQDAFRRAAAKTGKNFFTAPRVYLNLSTEEIVINEFAGGMWLWELLGALEQKNEAILAHARSINIDPAKIARRLLWVNNWAWEENLFFHADPHPNNIIIGKDSTLFFIDFTTTGTLSSSKRQALRQNLYYARERDPQNMARSTLILMEPLPPIDLIVLTQELESYNWQLLYALESSPDSLSWQERTSVVQWTGMLRLARKYGMTMEIQVLRVMRATLLMESMAVFLDPKINFVDQYWKFNRYRAEKARQRVTDGLQKQADGETDELTVIRLDRTFQTVEGLLIRLRHLLALPAVNFNLLMSKWSFAVYILFRFIGQVLVVTALGMLTAAALQMVNLMPVSMPFELLLIVIRHPLYLAAILMLIFISGRTVLFRMDDKEIKT